MIHTAPIQKVPHDHEPNVNDEPVPEWEVESPELRATEGHHQQITAHLEEEPFSVERHEGLGESNLQLAAGAYMQHVQSSG
jgi:hypothetical protein